MTKKEIWESYGVRRIWKPSESCEELTEAEEKAEREHAEAARRYFDELFGETGND